MSTYLIELALGPVQGFIASARRSRDLWAGSFLLSECARAAGKALADGGAELIYPLIDRVREENPDENSNLSNVLLAKLENADAETAARLARDAQDAARACLQEQADHALAQWQRAGVNIREDIWMRQVSDALESFAAWCRVDSDYRSAYEHTKAALGARKNTRNFAPMFDPDQADLGLGVPKSSLDGVRESVLPKGRKHFPLKFGVTAGEQLDALGCIKRVAGRQERFTALTRLAADGWLQQLSGPELGGMRTAYEPLVAAGLATRSEGNAGTYADFPYDAGLLFPERLEVALKDAGEQAREGGEDVRPRLFDLRKILQPLWREHGQPCPYAAIVVADGDRMGRFIDKATTAEEHSAVSRAIAAFADRVPAIARQHRGHSIFNGGEDLMVLFPLAGLIEGSRALSAAFGEAMQDVVTDLLGTDPSPEQVPTLRVGAAICHVQEPLGLIRTHGEMAEKFAKGNIGSHAQGNALGVQLHVRAGHVVPWRAPFDHPDDFASLQTWCDEYGDGTLPGKLAYRMRQAWLHGIKTGLDTEIVNLEVQRAITHASERGGATEIQQHIIERLAERAERWRPTTPDDETGFGALIDELILARWLSARSTADLGRENA